MKEHELTEIFTLILTEFEIKFKENVNYLLKGQPIGLQKMFRYHLGWDGKNNVGSGSGKRIRPLLLLLCIKAFDKDWQYGLHLATAVELIHNFSLIHDDIEDKSPKRRGREALWKKWGIAQAINTGDAMFTAGIKAGFIAIRNMDRLLGEQILERMINTCTDLTNGQHMDMEFESINTIEEGHYLQMITGKTASLLGFSAYGGTAFVGVSEPIMEAFYKFGKTLGLAFQIYDDYLGIWGREEITGKPVNIDLLEKKQTYPILLGLHSIPVFREIWKKKTFSSKDVEEMSTLLEASGIKKITIKKTEDLTSEAHDIISTFPITNGNKQMLHAFSDLLLARDY